MRWNYNDPAHCVSLLSCTLPPLTYHAIHSRPGNAIVTPLGPDLHTFSSLHALELRLIGCNQADLTPVDLSAFRAISARESSLLLQPLRVLCWGASAAAIGTGVWGDTGIADACQLYYARNADRCTSRAALFLLFFGRVHRGRSEAVRGGWRSPVGLYAALSGIQPNMCVQIT